MLGHTLIGIVDNIMVGNLGATELAAVSLGNSFIFLAMSIGIGFSTREFPSNDLSQLPIYRSE